MSDDKKNEAAVGAAAGDPEKIGPYRLLDVLGEGGMANVYLAEQTAPIRRRVALKIMKAGLDSKQFLARFESERQALAVLDHPNIAKIYDAGVAENGRPYFVMERVDGIPITDYCDDNRLTNAERLQLFIEVCAAVQHAHLKGLIHRDIKPSNVLITTTDGKPRPKIIDFGIAKATANTLTEHTLYTRVGQIIGTPAYMSPEQANLDGVDIDTRTDIYSLGVLLYELLVGVVPLDLRAAGPGSMSQVLREQIPARPSARFTTLGDARPEMAAARSAAPEDIRRELKGDLDWIVMCAIEKDRTRRYETVNALAMECRRFLKHQPVLARPPSPAYLFARFFRRNRLMVGAAAIALVAILAGMSAAWIGYLRATEAEAIATREAETSRSVSSFLVDLFKIANPREALGNTVTARELLDKGALRIEEDLKEQPDVQAALMKTMSDAYLGLGLYEPAEQLARSSLAVAENLYDSDAPQLAEFERVLGRVYHATGRYDEAEKIFRNILEKETRTFGKVHPRVATVLPLLAETVAAADQLELGEELAKRNLRVRQELYGSDHVEYADGLNTLSNIQRENGNYKDSFANAKRALEIYEANLAENHPSVMVALWNVSLNLSEQGRIAEEEPYVLRILDITRQIYGEGHAQHAETLQAVAIHYAKRRLFTEAEKYFKEALAGTIVAHGEISEKTGYRYYNLGYLYMDIGRYDDAVENIERAISIWTETLGADHSHNGWAWNALAQNYLRQNQLDEAEQAARRGLEINSSVYGEDHPNTTTSMHALADVAHLRGDLEQAEDLYRTVIDFRVARFGRSSARLGAVLQNYHELLLKAGRKEEADELATWLSEIEAANES